MRTRSMLMPTSWARIALRTVLCAVVLSVAACGGDDGPAPDRRAAAARLVPPAAFAATVNAPRTYVLNVHVPDEGRISGTDASIPFDRLRRRRNELPSRSTRIAVYCRTGRMSAIAVRTLGALGYRRIVELRGGMLAWRADGRPLLPPGAARL